MSIFWLAGIITMIDRKNMYPLGLVRGGISFVVHRVKNVTLMKRTEGKI